MNNQLVGRLCHTNKGQRTQGDSLYTTWIIKSMNYKDGSDIEKEVNSENQKYINTTLSSVYTIHGKILENKNSEMIMNTDFLVVELPNTEIKVGDTWKGKRSAKPDFIFDSIVTKYTCQKMNTEETILKVEMNFLEEKKSQPSQLKFNKKYTGYYTIYTATGTVKSAKLDISGFNGLSNMSGTIDIVEINK